MVSAILGVDRDDLLGRSEKRVDVLGGGRQPVTTVLQECRQDPGQDLSFAGIATHRTRSHEGSPVVSLISSQPSLKAGAISLTGVLGRNRRRNQDGAG